MNPRKTGSLRATWWPNKLTPNTFVVMSDRIYYVLGNGSLRRLPIGEAFNVRVQG